MSLPRLYAAAAESGNGVHLHHQNGYFWLNLEEAIDLRETLDAAIEHITPDPPDDTVDWPEHMQLQINDLKTSIDDMQKHLIRTGRWI